MNNYQHQGHKNPQQSVASQGASSQQKRIQARRQASTGPQMKKPSGSSEEMKLAKKGQTSSFIGENRNQSRTEDNHQNSGNTSKQQAAKISQIQQQRQTNIGFITQDEINRQDKLVTHTVRSSLNGASSSQYNQGGGAVANTIHGNSFTSLSGNDKASVSTQMRFKQAEISKNTAKNGGGKFSDGGYQKQLKKPSVVLKGGQVTTTNQKRQARTTHHSRQISRSRDEKIQHPNNSTSQQDLVSSSTIATKVSFKNVNDQHQLMHNKSKDEQKQHQNRSNIQQQQTQQVLTAAQKANQSQKSKMTQNILKRLKDSIDRGQVPASNSHQTATHHTITSNVLPSQISDAYLTNQQTTKTQQMTVSSKQRANHTQQKDSQISAAPLQSNTSLQNGQQNGGRLSTIIEANSNQKLLKQFIQQLSGTTGTLESTEQKTKQLRSIQNSLSIHAKAMNQDYPATASMNQRNSVVANAQEEIKQTQPRKAKSRDATLNQQKRQSASPNTSQPAQLMAAAMHSQQTGDNQHAMKRKVQANAMIYQTQAGPTSGAHSVNSYSLERASSNKQHINYQQQQSMVQDDSRMAGKHISSTKTKITQMQAELLKQAVQGKAAQPTNNISTVKKVQIISESNGAKTQKSQAKNKSSQNEGSKVTKISSVRQTPQAKLDMLLAQEQIKKGSGGVYNSQSIGKSNNGAMVVVQGKAQPRFKNPNTIVKRSQNLEGDVRGSYDYQQHGVVPQQTLDLTKSNLKQQFKYAPPVGINTQSGVPVQESKRKAKTTHARTPASYRSISGGRPGQQVYSGAPSQNEGSLANSPETMNYKIGSKKARVAQRLNDGGTKQQAQQINSHQTSQASTNPISIQQQTTKQHQLVNKTKFAHNQALLKSKQQSMVQSTVNNNAYQHASNVYKPSSINSLTSKQATNKLSAKTLSKQQNDTSIKQQATKGGSHKRSVSFKTSQQATSLIPSTIASSNQIQGPNAPQFTVNQKVQFQMQVLANQKAISGGLTTAGNKKQGGVVSPFRTRQPSINNSRRISQERQASKHSINSITSPRMQPSVKNAGVVKGGAHFDPPSKNKSWQQSSFLNKANSKSMNSSSNMLINPKGDGASNEMQKMLKTFIKQVAQKQDQWAPPSLMVKAQPRVEVSGVDVSSKAKPSSGVTSDSSKSKQKRAFNQRLMQQVLGGQDDETMALEGTTFNQGSTKEQRTFQDPRGDKFLGPQHSFQNASAGGFAPEGQNSSQPQINCSAFGENDIISGTFIATKSNERMSVYPEEVKETLLQKMPQRARIHRIPTNSQLHAANSFEDQVTLKTGDKAEQMMQMQQQLMLYEQREQQVSVLDGHLVQVTQTARSEGSANKPVIFQAFDEYVQRYSGKKDDQNIEENNNQEPAVDKYKNNNNYQGKRDKYIESNNIRDFDDVADQNQGLHGPIIDFHPTQQIQPEATNSPPAFTSEENVDTHRRAQANQENSNLLHQQQLQQQSQLNQNNIQERRDQIIQNGLETDSEEYESEIEVTEMYDPLLEDKQYLVTNIVTNFQEHGQPVATTHEFYRIGNKLGEGAFGKVCISQHKLSGHFVAIKCMRKRELNKQVECKKKVAQDMQILQHLTRNQNVVKLYDSFETQSHLCFVMELCAGGDLLGFVRRRKKLDEQMAKFLFKQVAKGLAYCHRNRVLHRDIKLENLLLDDEGTVKICDFGVSQLLGKATDLVKDQCGTPAYMAPEVFLCDQKYSGQKADVWSLGVCLFAMLCGMVPFKGRSITELKDAIVNQTLKYPKESKRKLSREARHLIKIMLRKDFNQRACIEQVLKHPWLRDTPKKMSVFSQSEIKKIKVLSQPAQGGDEPQRLLTEVTMTQQSLTESQKKKIQKNGGSDYSLDYGHKVKNVSDRSCVLAPFNSTITKEGLSEWLMTGVPIEDDTTLKFNDRVREANRQYEFNYNGEVDNGIMISVENESQKSSKQADEEGNKATSTSFDRRIQNAALQNSEQKLEAPQVSQQTISAQQQQDDISGSAPEEESKNGKQHKISRIGQQVKQKSMMSGAPIAKAPQISEATLNNNNNSGIQSSQSESVLVQPVINFNGLQQVGYNIMPSSPSPVSELVTNKKQTAASVTEGIIISAEVDQPQQAESSEDESLDNALDLNLQQEQLWSYQESDDEEQIDNLVVCKIENEFGYPEQYLLDCLKNDRKNDATTCYYLFCKEDKHEIVNLLNESPTQVYDTQHKGDPNLKH